LRKKGCVVTTVFESSLPDDYMEQRSIRGGRGQNLLRSRVALDLRKLCEKIPSYDLRSLACFVRSGGTDQDCASGGVSALAQSMGVTGRKRDGAGRHETRNDRNASAVGSRRCRHRRCSAAPSLTDPIRNREWPKSRSRAVTRQVIDCVMTVLQRN
jgi:hypothetical protein